MNKMVVVVRKNNLIKRLNDIFRRIFNSVSKSGTNRILREKSLMQIKSARQITHARKNIERKFMLKSSNIEGMKKIIAEKKKQSAQQGAKDEKTNQKKVSQQKAFRNTKRGGFFDK